MGDVISQRFNLRVCLKLLFQWGLHCRSDSAGKRTRGEDGEAEKRYRGAIRKLEEEKHGNAGPTIHLC